MNKNKDKTPLHTRFGLRLLQVLLIIFALLLLKRCVDIYHDNKLIQEQTRIEYYEKGFISGFKKAQGLPENAEAKFRKYALKKAYRNGYRQGWDKGRENLKQR